MTVSLPPLSSQVRSHDQVRAAVASFVCCVSPCSLPCRVSGDRSCGWGPPGHELVAVRFRHGVRRRGGADARLPHRLHCPLHSSWYGNV